MVWGAIIGGIAGIAGAFASGGSSSNRAQVNAQYEADTDRWNYDRSTLTQSHNFRLQENATARLNQENRLGYEEATQRQSYLDQLAIRNYDYQNQMRQFQQSERIYGMQLQFNNQAAQVARESESRRFQEIITGMAFDQQDMLVKMLQEEGQVQAAGVSGRSAGKVLASAVASYGRNQAILAESLVSAKKETKIARKQIEMDKYGADLNANARRMLAPIKAPAPSAPLSIPRAVILDPPKPIMPPRPTRGAVSGGGTNPFAIASSGLSALSSIGTAAKWWS
jgi:hypothetical protein